MKAVLPGDQARASVLVKVDCPRAFDIFTQEIDRWWRHGLRYRVAGGGRSILRLEPGVGGRVYESFETTEGKKRTVVTGRITEWQPPNRLVLEWRAVNFAPNEKTEVEVAFEAQTNGTLVTVTHRGWAHIRVDHPARHGHDSTAFLRMLGLRWGDLLTSLRERAQTTS